MSKVIQGIMVGVAAFGVLLVISFVLAIITQLAWNYVMPDVFSLPKVTFLQAFALNVLSAQLVKSSTTVNRGAA